MKNGGSIVSLDSLIHAALTGGRYCQSRLGKEAKLYARRISTAHAPDLPEDLHDDVFQQAFEEMLKAGAQALASRTGKALFRDAVVKATRIIRAAYAPPGQRTRRYKALLRARVAAEHVGRIANPDIVEQSLRGDDRSIDFDAFVSPDWQATLAAVEHRLDLQKLLPQAPPAVERALRLIHFSKETLESAATKAGLSRFALARRLEAFSEVVSAAA